MATEAQRLMMMSLGKIQGCRQQRGGINLYKSLLVSKVLYRARSVALSEHTSPKEEQDQCVPEVVMQPQSETCTEKSEETHVDYDDHTQDKENTRPVESPSRHNKPLCSQDGFRNLENKPVNQERAARCVKRRLTEVEQAVESISPKKQKLEDTQAHAHEPMQVELSSLVNHFSSTFTGLLTTDTDNFTGEDSTGEEGHGHTSGETSLLSCSTQIKESFELLVRPIALSV